jgi:hypothetical protein
MRTRTRFGLVVLGLTAVAMLTGGASRAKAGPMIGSGDPFNITFDENGNGSISVNGGPVEPLQGSLMPDPTNGGVPALTYLLPQRVVTGTLLIYEDAGKTILGDALRFTDAAGTISGGLSGDGVRMIFYSALGGGMLADTGFPANILTGGPTSSIVENADGTFDYLPGGVQDNQYHGVSQEVSPAVPSTPEPSSLSLLALGGVALAGWRRWKKRRATA